MISDQAAKSAVTLPKGIRVEHENGGLVLTRRWFTKLALPSALAAAGWQLFSAFWLSSILKEGITPIFFAALIFAILGIFVLYVVLGMAVNRTRIRANSERVCIATRPFPLTRTKDIQATSIDQLYCRERPSPDAAKTLATRHLTTKSLSFDLVLITDRGEEHFLVESLSTYEQARFLEQELESFLRIRDRAVGGEYQA